MGAGRSGWTWSVLAVSVAGVVAVMAAGGSPGPTAATMLVIQAATVLVTSWCLVRLLISERPTGESVLFMNWRDRKHPQGGGSEVFVEEVAGRLAASGRTVTIFCAEHEYAPRDEIVDGVRFVRRGTWRTIYLWGAAYHLLGRFGDHDVVVDVQNAVPFFSPIFCARRVVVLVHHLHREQWRILFGRRIARAGWWVESRLTPIVYRRCSYVAVSEATRRDLAALGVDRGRVTVARNGTSLPLAGEPSARRPEPTIVYVGRLVPHKRVELLLDAAAVLRREFAGLRVRIVGRGPWEAILRSQADERGLSDTVTFDGFLSSADRDAALASAWVLAMPSVKEGWGLAVVEAGAVGTPSVAFRTGGLTESIVDGETGLLADSFEEFVDGLRAVLRSPDVRDRLGERARAHALGFTWEATTDAVIEALEEARSVRSPRTAAAVADRVVVPERDLGSYGLGEP
jgi:glycosyltransferase involved in cell wall biosynthesis